MAFADSSMTLYSRWETFDTDLERCVCLYIYIYIRYIYMVYIYKVYIYIILYYIFNGILLKLPVCIYIYIVYIWVCLKMGYGLLRENDDSSWGFWGTLSSDKPTMWGPRLIAKLVNITPITMVYGTQITIVTGANLNQLTSLGGLTLYNHTIISL